MRIIIKVIKIPFVFCVVFALIGCERQELRNAEKNAALECQAFCLYEKLTLFAKYHDALESASSLSDLDSVKTELLLQAEAIVMTIENDENLRSAINELTPFLNERIKAVKDAKK